MKTTLLTLCCLLAGAAQAQTVWRCGPDGRSYAETPCPQGRPVEVTQQARPAADLQQAQLMARREQALASQLAQERRQREARATSTPAGIRTSRPQAAPPITSKAKAPAKSKRQPEEPGIWRAVVPASRRGQD